MNTKLKIGLAAVLIVAIGGGAIGLASSARSRPSPTSHVLTFAEGPGAAPNYIFPYMSCTNFSVATINAFQFEMYRPLYWFGFGANATYTPALSLAAPPVMSNGDRTITIRTKGWKFADGQSINAQSVMFFLNMYHSVPTDYCGYNKGYGIPDQLASAQGSGDAVTLHFTTSVNPKWILYNYLSEITPMANVWDVSAPGRPSTCASGAYGAATTDAACKAVYTYLTAQASMESTYTDTLWQSGVSGPWTLRHFDNLGNVTFVANPAYSGPQKAQVSSVVELPFTTTSAEQIALRAGKVDLGYIDPSSVTQLGTPTQPGANWSPIANNFNLEVGAPWSVDYAPYNFNPLNPQSKFLDQLYVRQALQMTVDQPLMIRKILKGYGYPQTTPLPPVTPVAISGPVSTRNPYPYDPTAAATLLRHHGWRVVGGQLTCEAAGTAATECGAGIGRGDVLAITVLYGSGIPSLQTQVDTEVSEWRSLGIDATENAKPFNEVVGDCVSSSSSWSVCLWGAGWIFAPDYYPSGESLFVPGASFNIGAYSNPALTAAVKRTTFGTATLAEYSQLTAQQLPVLFQPNGTIGYAGSGIGEVIKTLKSSDGAGFTPNSLTNFMPEYYHF